VTNGSAALVFDTGPMRHFALRGWLGVLKFVAAERRVVIPESVAVELNEQCIAEPVLRQVVDADWVKIDRSDDLAFVLAFADFERRLVGSSGENRGECGVLALGKTRGYEIVIDDGVARQIASEESQSPGLKVTTTLALLCDAIRQGKLTVPMVEQLADDLLSGDYYLPFGPGGFRRWSMEEGLLEL